MRDRRAKFSDRRHSGTTPAYPFTDRHGAEVDACRRQARDRRKDSLQAAMIALGSLRDSGRSDSRVQPGPGPALRSR